MAGFFSEFGVLDIDDDWDLDFILDGVGAGIEPKAPVFINDGAEVAGSREGAKQSLYDMRSLFRMNNNQKQIYGNYTF